MTSLVSPLQSPDLTPALQIHTLASLLCKDTYRRISHIWDKSKDDAVDLAIRGPEWISQSSTLSEHKTLTQLEVEFNKLLIQSKDQSDQQLLSKVKALIEERKLFTTSQANSQFTWTRRINILTGFCLFATNMAYHYKLTDNYDPAFVSIIVTPVIVASSIFYYFVSRCSYRHKIDAQALKLRSLARDVFMLTDPSCHLFTAKAADNPSKIDVDVETKPKRCHFW